MTNLQQAIWVSTENRVNILHDDNLPLMPEQSRWLLTAVWGVSSEAISKDAYASCFSNYSSVEHFVDTALSDRLAASDDHVSVDEYTYEVHKKEALS